MLEINHIINKIIEDKCEHVLPFLPDKICDWLITYPPYGIFGKNDTLSSEQTHYSPMDWDIKPNQEIINQMIRISKNQIIFGAEHLCTLLPQSRGWIVWDKKKTGSSFADCEMVWTSLDWPTKMIRYEWNGFLVASKEKRFHPTQKPLALMIKIIKDYTKENDLVIDSYAGSGTTLLACKLTKRRYIGIEMKKEYCEVTKKRLEQEALDVDDKGELIIPEIINSKQIDEEKDYLEKEIHDTITKMKGLVDREGAIIILMNKIKSEEKNHDA